MPSEINVPEDVKELINKIISRNNLDPTSNVTYNVGSELGDGFLSKTIAVDIENQNNSIHLFVKYALNAKHLEETGLNKIYDNEIHFYDVIVPAYVEFWKEKGLTDSFHSVPRCYGTSNGIVVLENLRKKGYDLCDKQLVANDEHITLVFKTYAKFHATGFAFKDQKPEEYQKILAGVTDVYRLNMDDETAAKREESTRGDINNFLKQLDAAEDKFILDRSGRIADDIIEFADFLKSAVFENSVLLQGDCWCNNMMFTYKNNKAVPLDVMLIDWQIIRSGSPVLDLSYFFYTAASSSKNTLSELQHYMNIYHEELTIQMRKMGSDIESIYLYSTFEAEWKQFCKLGYMMAYIILRAMLSTKDEMPDFEKMDMKNSETVDMFPTLARNDELVDRLRNLTKHFLLNGLL